MGPEGRDRPENGKAGPGGELEGLGNENHAMPMTRRIHEMMDEYLPKIYRFLFARPMFYNLNKMLFNFSLRGMGVLNFENYEVSGELHFLQSYFSNCKNLTVFDVGANEGNYSKLIMKIAPSTHVYAFEPHPKALLKLREVSDEYGFKAFPFGCGKANYRIGLYDYIDRDGSPHASLYPDVIRKIHGSCAREHTVDIIKLDDFVLQYDISDIDLLKIDTEGHELDVLIGLKNFIGQGKVKTIHFEFNEMNVISRVFFRDIHMLLKDQYDFFRMLRRGLVPMKEYDTVFWEIFAYQNIVARLKPGYGN
jgi:FkbM family methyltransferase